MRALSQRLNGQLYQRQEQTALLLQESAGPLFVRYALILLGTEAHIFPAFALDDWGTEHKSLALYKWIYEEGQRFPRAEVFGLDAQGQQMQVFLRDVETFFKFPCYAYPNRQTTIVEGHLVSRVLVADLAHSGAPEKIAVPPDVGWPLRHAAVLWQRVDPARLEQHGWQSLSSD